MEALVLALVVALIVLRRYSSRTVARIHGSGMVRPAVLGLQRTKIVIARLEGMSPLRLSCVRGLQFSEHGAIDVDLCLQLFYCGL